MIGIVGGMGYEAGIDLYNRVQKAGIPKKNILIISNTNIPDRTEYLDGIESRNPGPYIAIGIKGLLNDGATQIGIACNTAHHEEILGTSLRILEQKGIKVPIIHMIQEVAKTLKADDSIKKVGVLSTRGTLEHGIYQRVLEAAGQEVIPINKEFNDYYVHDAIYHPDFGIKFQYGKPALQKAIDRLAVAVSHLESKGADRLVLGCTEIPLVADQLTFKDQPINATQVLADSLVRAFQNSQL